MKNIMLGFLCALVLGALVWGGFWLAALKAKADQGQQAYAVLAELASKVKPAQGESLADAILRFRLEPSK
jgi:hypothetical protein